MVEFYFLSSQPYVVKTTQPGPSHDLLRSAAWGFRRFPSQVSERAARLDYLATSLISDVLPVVTDGQVTSPKSFGYTQLPNGYAQLIERVEGRASVIPVAGNFLPFSAQALVNTGSENGLIWHYAVRDYIAKLSAIHPAGGWGTQLEAELYNKFGPRIEKLAVRDN